MLAFSAPLFVPHCPCSSQGNNTVLWADLHGISASRGLVDAHYHTNPQNMNTSRPRILNNFQVKSSVPNFHCAALDDLRRRGAIPGRYNCNGNGVDMLSGDSGRWHRGRGGGGIEWLPVTLASAVCTWLLSAYP